MIALNSRIGRYLVNAKDSRSIIIKALENSVEIDICARMMANSEPWISLRRDYEASVETLSVPSKEVYLALSNEEIVGFIILNMQGGFIGYIQTVCVLPGMRGAGIGSKLLDFVEERVLRETPNVFICVSSFNTRALRLYRRHGYAVVGELPDYVISGHSEILLRKSVAPLSEFTKTSSG